VSEDGHVYTHSHGGHSHSHVPEGKVNMASLIALGASGGLVPCPSALVLLLTAVSLGRAGLGLMLLVAFSAGLALVLMGIGALVLYAKNLIPERTRTAAPALRYVPVFSAVVVIVLGVLMTGVSMGWIRPGTMLG
jgi:ABC-type nickel/cobalt efflux system permease component RcnA